MTVEITETTEVYCVWFLAITSRSDFLAVVLRNSADEPWRAVYRQRFSFTPDKAWYQVRKDESGAPASRDVLVGEMDRMFNTLKQATGSNTPHVRAVIDAVGIEAHRRFVRAVPHETTFPQPPAGTRDN